MSVDLKALKRYPAQIITVVGRPDGVALVLISPEERDAAVAALERIPELERVLAQKQPALEAAIEERRRLEACLETAQQELETIERCLANDRACLVPEKAGMSTAELVQAALAARDDAVHQGWAYAGVVEDEGHRDRREWEAAVEQARGVSARAVETAARLREALERHAPGALAALDIQRREIGDG